MELRLNADEGRAWGVEGGQSSFQGQDLKGRAPARALGGGSPEDTPRTGTGQGQQSGDGEVVFQGSERQPRRCLMIQEGSRDVSHLPDTLRRVCNVTDTGRTRGLKGFRSCNRDTMVRAAGDIPLETMGHRVLSTREVGSISCLSPTLFPTNFPCNSPCNFHLKLKDHFGSI